MSSVKMPVKCNEKKILKKTFLQADMITTTEAPVASGWILSGQLLNGDKQELCLGVYFICSFNS